MKSGAQKYQRFSFAIQLGASDREVWHAGFEECSGLGFGPTSAGARVTKITGINKSTDVTLKRGVVSAADLNAWLDEVRRGSSGFRDVIVAVQSDPKQPARKWKLVRARIIKHTSGPLNAKGTDISMAELVLSCEGIEEV